MFIPDKEHIKLQGAIENPDGQCVDKMSQKAGGKIGVYYCHGMGGNQAFMYTVLNELRVEDDLCLDSWGNLPADVCVLLDFVKWAFRFLQVRRDGNCQAGSGPSGA